MKLLSRDELKELMDKRESPCVSIYLPTQRAGKEVEQNPIRFKNRIREAEEQLLAQGHRLHEVAPLLEHPQRLLTDSGFWREQSDGLALFVCKRLFRYYCMPCEFPDLTVVTDRFHLKPLLPLLVGGGRFYVLAVSQEHVRLLQGSQYSVSEVDIKRAPENLETAIRSDLPQKHLQFYTGTPHQGGGRRDAVFFGTGANDPDVKGAILRYFQQVDKGLQEVLRNERVPLVLAGVEYLFPLFREASSYAHFVDEGISGNPDDLSAEELHQRAWSIVRPHFQKSQYAAAAKYRELVGTGRASDNLEEVVRAAYYGRIESLFVGVGTQRWGSFDVATNEVKVREKADPGDEDLLDFAAIHTFMGGGAVYLVDAKDLPSAMPLAAVLRY